MSEYLLPPNSYQLPTLRHAAYAGAILATTLLVVGSCSETPNDNGGGSGTHQGGKYHGNNGWTGSRNNQQYRPGWRMDAPPSITDYHPLLP